MRIIFSFIHSLQPFFRYFGETSRSGPTLKKVLVNLLPEKTPEFTRSSGRFVSH